MIGHAALKIDMSKAYDMVEWEFVLGVFRRMGFAEKWCTWINLCMSTVTYRLVISSNEIGPIIPSRGLRQGDPISPFLFLMCAEGLSALIHIIQAMGAIHGCKIANGAPVFTHLFFADDCYLFFRANVKEAECIKECLILYERASGQQVNFQKSSISFSRNMLDSKTLVVGHVLQVPVRLDAIYLGLPRMISSNICETFRYVKEKNLE